MIKFPMFYNKFQGSKRLYHWQFDLNLKTKAKKENEITGSIDTTIILAKRDWLIQNLKPLGI